MIQFTCPCGKALHAQDEHAGQTMRCPACGRDLDIPDAAGVQTADAPRSAGPATGRGRAGKAGSVRGQDREDRPRPPTTSGKAITSVILGVLSLMLCSVFSRPAGDHPGRPRPARHRPRSGPRGGKEPGDRRHRHRCPQLPVSAGDDRSAAPGRPEGAGGGGQITRREQPQTNRRRHARAITPRMARSRPPPSATPPESRCSAARRHPAVH